MRVAHSVPLIGYGIGAILSGLGEFEVVRPVGRSSGAADVLIADVEAGLGSGTHRNTLIIAQDDGEAVIRKALQKGVRGFLLHTCAAHELTAAVRALNRGGTAFAPRVANRIAQSFSFEPLSDRELEVLHLLMQARPTRTWRASCSSHRARWSRTCARSSRSSAPHAVPKPPRSRNVVASLAWIARSRTRHPR